jgi:hypothetical protein
VNDAANASVLTNPRQAADATATGSNLDHTLHPEGQALNAPPLTSADKPSTLNPEPWAYMEGVNHCRSQCRLAQFRGLVYRGEYSAVIGFKQPIARKFVLGTCIKNVFRPITALYFPPYIKPRNFARRQCERQWLTPPTYFPNSDPLNHQTLQLKS